MKIALIGYGKMGKEIEKIAIERGHTISIKIDQANIDDFKSENFKSSDVCIEFTQPSSAVSNYKQCFNNNIPVVSGTTGWLEQFDELTRICKEKNQTFFYASNFSIGVNIFFEINKKLAQLMSNAESYKVEIEEIHHTQKLDVPSGTAISLAEQIIDSNFPKESWSLQAEKANELKIEAKRIENVPGTHTIIYSSDIDEITIKHEAKNRKGFALGAVLAAEFVQNKKGVFNMKDMFEF